LWGDTDTDFFNTLAGNMSITIRVQYVHLILVSVGYDAAQDDLLAQMQATGMPVRLAIEGSVDDLPKGVDLSMYRIIQEALTNSLKHSSHSAVDVVVRRIHDAIEVEVQDAGPALNGNAPGVGHGLIGMRERTALYGGVFEAGPRIDGGFDVKATLPIDPA